mmetsp:Transcript_19072/g.44423  ORF Transcript_19072/g.44423 Transcript_19072/m.44423 type:complete len:379 (+) Transcript_19072:12-1148(+)
MCGQTLRYQNLLLVIKQTAYEEYSRLKLGGRAPKALRWKRLESRFQAHKECVNRLLEILKKHQVNFSCVNRAELDRQHLAGIDLVVGVGGDGTILSSAHFLDHGTIPLLGINSDPMVTKEEWDVKKKVDERRSHGALCMCTAVNMNEGIGKVLYGGGNLATKTRIQCVVKSTFSETRLVPGLNDILIANPSPAAVSRFRMGWLEKVAEDAVHGGRGGNHHHHPNAPPQSGLPVSPQYGTVTRFGFVAYDVKNSLNVWSSGMWICTATGSTAAMAAAGGKPMDFDSSDLQYLIREHMIEDHHNVGGGNNGGNNEMEMNVQDMNNGMLKEKEKMHIRWNSQQGCIFIDGSHQKHSLELGDEILVDNSAPPLQMFIRENVS